MTRLPQLWLRFVSKYCPPVVLACYYHKHNVEACPEKDVGSNNSPGLYVPPPTARPANVRDLAANGIQANIRGFTVTFFRVVFWITQLFIKLYLLLYSHKHCLPTDRKKESHQPLISTVEQHHLPVALLVTANSSVHKNSFTLKNRIRQNSSCEQMKTCSSEATPSIFLARIAP